MSELPELRLTGEQLGSIEPPVEGDWFVDFDEYEEFVPNRLLDAERARPVPPDGLRAATAWAFENLHDRDYWHDGNRTHAREWSECKDDLCVERTALLAASPAPLDVERLARAMQRLVEHRGLDLYAADAADLAAEYEAKP